ncbi:hypothetical protein D3C72_2028220 [compost metagenome]
MVQDAVRIDGAHAAIVVGDDADFLGAQFVHGDQQRAHHRAPLVGDQRAGVLDQFEVAVLQPHRLGQQFHQPGVHAGQHDQVLVREFVGGKLLVFARFDEGAVVFQQAVKQAHGVLLS